MALEGFERSECSVQDIRKFIEEHHYSKNLNGVKTALCFRMDDPDSRLVGAIVFAEFGMANVWKKYGDTREEVIELRRLVCVDDTPKNAESYLIGWCLRWLRKNTSIKTVVSYADPHYGHSGAIYRATNFTHTGMTSPGRVIDYNGRLYHDKTIRTYYNGRLKPYAARIRDALASGDAPECP